MIILVRRSIFFKILDKTKIVGKNKKMGRECISDLPELLAVGKESISVLPEEFSIRLESISEVPEKFSFGVESVFFIYLKHEIEKA